MEEQLETHLRHQTGNQNYPPTSIEPTSKASLEPPSDVSLDQKDGVGLASRARSSLRQRYEAEARVIERRIGGLEKARETLGLSQRKMAQLLLVDPSAWTRWTQQGQGAPPHVWRALAWYLALQDKYPALDAAFWLQGVARSADGDRISQNADEIRAAKLQTRSLELKVQELSREIARLQQIVPTEDLKSIAGPIEKKEQAETRAIANFFMALTFLALGFLAASLLF